MPLPRSPATARIAALLAAVLATALLPAANVQGHAAQRRAAALDAPPGATRNLAGVETRRTRTGLQVAVSIRTNDVGRARSAVTAAGGETVNEAVGLIEAYVPPDAVEALRGAPGIRTLSAIRRPVEHAVLGTGVALEGANAWQAAGLTGAGVRIGIIDGGFAGLPSLVGSRITGQVVGRCYATIGTPTSALAACDGGDPHGAAVAETIAAVAPGASLYVANPQSRLDEIATIAWMTGAGVRIINASWTSGDVFEGPGDGTSPDPASTYALVDRAVAGGALWVGAAGNSGQDNWSGPWADADGNGWLDFAPGDEDDRFTLPAGTDVTVALRWNEPWGHATSAFDLGLYASDGVTVVASATSSPTGAADPVRVLSATVPVAGTYSVAVHRSAGSGPSRLQILVDTSADAPLQYLAAAGSFAAPADGRNEGMVTVGAVDVASPDVIEPYSSQGPTIDGRLKPDVVAGDCADTTLVADFCGTSQAAPFAAGAVALLAQVSPGATPGELAALLRAHAVPLGSPTPNGIYGSGRVDLGSPPATNPSPPPPSPARTSTLAVSAPFEARAWQALAVTPTAVHVLYTAGNGPASVDYRRSSDGGFTFDPPVALSDAVSDVGLASLAAAGRLVVATWQQAAAGGSGSSAIWLRRSVDDGATWGPAAQVSVLPDPVGPPSVAVDAQGHVLVAWTDATTGRVWTRASPDGGGSFGIPLTIGSTSRRSATGGGEGLDGAPIAAFGSSGVAYVGWASGPTRVLLRRTTDGGPTWSPVFVVDARASGAVEPWVAADGAGVAIAYGAPPSAGRQTAIYVRRSDDLGSHWTGRLVAAASPLPLAAPAIVLKGRVIRMLYSQCVTGACDAARLAYRQTGNGGSSWSTAVAQTDGATFAVSAGIAQTTRIVLAYAESVTSGSEASTVFVRIR